MARRPIVRVLSTRETASEAAKLAHLLSTAGCDVSCWLDTDMESGSDPHVLDAQGLRCADAVAAVISHWTACSVWTVAELSWAHAERRVTPRLPDKNAAMPTLFVTDEASLCEMLRIAWPQTTLVGSSGMDAAVAAWSRELCFNLEAEPERQARLDAPGLSPRTGSSWSTVITAIAWKLSMGASDGSASQRLDKMIRLSGNGVDGGRLAWMVDQGFGIDGRPTRKDAEAAVMLSTADSQADPGDMLAYAVTGVKIHLFEQLRQSAVRDVLNACGRLPRKSILDQVFTKKGFVAARIWPGDPDIFEFVLRVKGHEDNYGTIIGAFSGGTLTGPAVVNFRNQVEGDRADFMVGNFSGGRPLNVRWYGSNGTCWGVWKDGEHVWGRQPPPAYSAVRYEFGGWISMERLG